jgi:baculoviral IAP repeat-containing protein 6
MDIIEGLDVDREDAIDKFLVKSEIADLFLRLWMHPNGECRQSVLRVHSDRVEKFGSSISAAIGYLLDDAVHRLEDVCKDSKRRRSRFSSSNQQFIEYQSDMATSNFLSSRRLLLLLIELSKEPKLASIFGGSEVKEGRRQSAAADLAIMAIHFLDRMTSSEGATDPGLDFREKTEETTLSLFGRLSLMPLEEKGKVASSLAKSRYIARKEYGLDVSVISHGLLALAARWHLDSQSKSQEATPFLISFGSHDDCDLPRYQKILERLIDLPGELHGTEAENAAPILLHDGYVDCSIWEANYSSPAESQSKKGRRRRARQDIISSGDISVLASSGDISRFLKDLQTFLKEKASDRPTKLIAEDKVAEVEKAVMESGENSESEAYYGEVLSDWVVSSSPFSSQTVPGSYVHYYDLTARSKGSCGSAKVLVKEARRCHKTLPAPHANSASYVCYAEERMDLCRAVITGPTDTPYALGIYTFDVYYPVLYPQIPPLVTFMTTGGGQTRFGPNLYQDGKVCLSLLGTFHATDESERWNPRVSSLAQILLSIQTQLLVKEPYFMEPGTEQMRGTQIGRDGSFRYNSNLKLATLRHAIVAQLRNPPAGFEEVCLRHFSTCRKRIVAQARRWMLEAKGTALYPRFQRVYAELLAFLSSEALQKYDCLPPINDDVKALRQLDPDFARCLGEEDDRKPSAVPRESADVDPGFNPWAEPLAAASDFPHTGPDDDSSDDEMYDFTNTVIGALDTGLASHQSQQQALPGASNQEQSTSLGTSDEETTEEEMLAEAIRRSLQES